MFEDKSELFPLERTLEHSKARNNCAQYVSQTHTNLTDLQTKQMKSNQSWNSIYMHFIPSVFHMIQVLHPNMFSTFEKYSIQ
jgi:hypothetical protein